MNEAVIVAGVRTAVGKAPRGALRTTRPDDRAAAVIADLLKRVPALPPESIDDVIIGCATPEAESGANVARITALRAGHTKYPPLPSTVSVRRVHKPSRWRRNASWRACASAVGREPRRFSRTYNASNSD